jgi:hypothetical protein
MLSTMLEEDRNRAGWSVGRSARRLGVSVEYRDTTNPAILRVDLKVTDVEGGGYRWVQCSACDRGWQVPHFAVESVG